MDVRAHEQSQDGGDYTVEEDLGCDEAFTLRGGGPFVRGNMKRGSFMY